MRYFFGDVHRNRTLGVGYQVIILHKIYNENTGTTGHHGMTATCNQNVVLARVELYLYC